MTDSGFVDAGRPAAMQSKSLEWHRVCFQRDPSEAVRRLERQEHPVVVGSGSVLFEANMESLYGVVVGVILLFPWSLVGIMVAGSVWARVKPNGRVRDRR
jgi:hypothetical protein